MQATLCESADYCYFKNVVPAPVINELDILHGALLVVAHSSTDFVS